MKIFSNRYPNNIPYLLSGFIGVVLTVFGFTALIAEMYIGRPSSTSCLGFIFLPIYVVLISLFCFAVGKKGTGTINSKQQEVFNFNTFVVA